ncbi:MAG: DUF2092 domain-containing protein [Acidobacteria bacterium]|nr:DUF2092 domain-containing protein [Acidobacteriota bacterium]
MAGIVPAARLVAQPATPAKAAASTPQVPSDAKPILKSMSNYISGLKSLELTFDSDIEVITPQLEKIQFTSSGTVLLVRPDKLRAHRVGGYADVELIFDGKAANIYGKNLNAYTQFELPGTVDQLIAALRAGHGVAMPGGDLLVSNPYDVLIADVQESKHIGRGVVEGVDCEHLAFRNGDTDWQIWIEVGARPMPRKFVITSKTLAGAPQYTVRIKAWKTDLKPAAEAFAFVPPAGAQKVRSDALIDLDELPQGLPLGGSK